ncbi:MAG: RNA 2',3'-cyclic phosphodiesterase [Alphaproteobacteria bacterium]|nr:MAG: RNA 2',3'-cyclic phosphodiesterase [Alphaproteobacteria bacterium]
MRSFVALMLPEAVREALEALQDELPVGRALDPEGLHVTLAFLGDQPRLALEALDAELAAIRQAPIPLELAGLDVWGGARPRSLVALVRPDPALTRLHKAVRAAAGRAGMELERVRFRPHVTLARFGRLDEEQCAKLGRFLSARGGAALPGFTARDFSLMRSTLTPEGAFYDSLADYPLEAA